ncbi:MAG: DUF3052 family protein [Gemmatimonadota bacterium]
MSAGYSGTPLIRKLGMKEGARVRVIDAPRGYRALLGTLPRGVKWGRNAGHGPYDFVHWFTRESTGLAERLRELKRRIEPNGMIWVSWPKRASKVQTEVTEDAVRAAALRVGLVDVKVCAVDETWSGLKLVIPLKERTR